MLTCLVPKTGLVPGGTDLERPVAADRGSRRLSSATKTDFEPEIGLILGTGLGELGDRIDTACAIPYGEVPHFVESTATSHDGKLVLGTLGGRRVVAMQGRVHYYEGYSMQQITLPVRVMKALGCRGPDHEQRRGRHESPAGARATSRSSPTTST